MNKRYSKVIERLHNKEIVILDGAIGTELEKRGVQMDETWSGSASLKFEILKKIHIDYIKAGDVSAYKALIEKLGLRR